MRTESDCNGNRAGGSTWVEFMMHAQGATLGILAY